MRRPITLLLALLAVTALAACGNKEDKVLHGATEGIYLDLGELKYQVQISRVLNPTNPEDRSYLVGLDQSQAELPAGQEWFAVFMRVQNESDKVQKPATRFDITDTQEQEYNPVSIDKTANVFAYDPVAIPGKGLLPNVNSIASQNSINGELLLFKMPRTTLDNRPLELKIHNPDDSQSFGTVNLDV
jgi:hypothetical protein